MTDIFTQEFLDSVDETPFENHLIFNTIRYNVSLENNKECECSHSGQKKKYTMTLCNNDSYEGFYEDKTIYIHFDTLEELNSSCSKPIGLITPTKGIIFSTKLCSICREDRPHYLIIILLQYIVFTPNNSAITYTKKPVKNRLISIT